MAWLNTNWLHRKQVNITGQTGAGTNYQVLLKIGESSGASDYDFHLEGNSADFPAAKDDGGDLRFTAADGTTLLDFWVEKVVGSGPNRTAWVWVEVSADLGSNQSIYCYYANSSAPSNGSNGDNTFLFFDDFNAALDTTTKWTVGGASPSQSGTELTLNAGGAVQRITSQTKWTTGIAARWYFKNSSLRSYGLGGAGLASGAASYDNAVDGVGGWFYNNNGKYYSFDKGGAQSAAVYSGSWDTNYHTWEARRVAGSKSALYLDDTLAQETTNTTYITDASIGAFASMRDGCTGIADWVCVRKFQLSEPDFSTAGSQEDASTTYDQAMTATTSVSASVIKGLDKTLSAGATVSASVLKQLTQTFNVTATATASLFKQMAKTFDVTATINAALEATKVYLLDLDASLSISATLTKVPGKLLDATSTITATLTKTISTSKILEATATVTASLTKGLSKTLGATTTIAASLTKIPGKLLEASTAITATIDKIQAKVLEATVNVSASLESGRAVVMNATTTVTAEVSKQVGKLLSVTATITAKILAPFWRTKYPAHGDEDDYEIKYPHD